MRRRARPPRFDERWQRRGRRKQRPGGVLRMFRASLALALVLGLLVVAQRLGLTEGETWALRDGRVPVCGDGSRGAAMCAIDGDTLAAGPRRIRLTGYDAPETDGPCEAEREKAREATAELSRWLSAQPFELSGGDDPPHDTYGRELRSARRVVSGTDRFLGRGFLADHMLERGLAGESGWGAEETDWCG